MSKPSPILLQVRPINPYFDGRIAEFGEVVPLWTDAGRARLADVAPQIEVLATSALVGCTAEQMAAAPNLKAIVNFGVGWDGVDVPAARARGIAVSNTPAVLDDCVADLAFALVLDTMRGTVAADRYARAGKWEKAIFPLTTRVSGKKLGILGLGRIGKVLARRASGFDMEVGYHNRRADPAAAYRYFADLRDLAGWADVLVVLCPGGPATRHLVDASVLEALGPESFLVNAARGSVVDTEALIAALEGRRIAGAGLDVYEDEPHVPAALIGRDDVVLLPHIASGTRETRKAMADLTLENIASFLATGRLKTPIPE